VSGQRRLDAGSAREFLLRTPHDLGRQQLLARAPEQRLFGHARTLELEQGDLAMTFARSAIPFAVVAALGGLAGCAGKIQFSGSQPVQIAGTERKQAEAPPPPRVELRDNKIVFDEKIQFEYNQAVIKPESFSLLHEIADVIEKNAQVKKIQIDGHASAEGSPAHNKWLSDQRAKAVMKHLIEKESIAAERLVAKGWGIEQPIASNDDEAGREKNRRVEFNVIDQVVTQKQVEIDPRTGKERVLSESAQQLNAKEEKK
jgi:outer membrane protein OmpA-like peptidoglycan-associated protein